MLWTSLPKRAECLKTRLCKRRLSICTLRDWLSKRNLRSLSRERMKSKLVNFLFTWWRSGAWPHSSAFNLASVTTQSSASHGSDGILWSRSLTPSPKAPSCSACTTRSATEESVSSTLAFNRIGSQSNSASGSTSTTSICTDFTSCSKRSRRLTKKLQTWRSRGSSDEPQGTASFC